MSWVRSDWEILPWPTTQVANAQLYDAVMVVVSQNIGKKSYVPAKSWTKTCGVTITLSTPPQLLLNKESPVSKGRASLVFILRDITRFTVLLPHLVQ